jgi:hypothetical protein
MAVAPLNKFLTFSVPVAPGEQVIYTTPVGISAILLYAQVSNVSSTVSYPTVTFLHRRKTNKTGNVRDTRIVKNIEVPPSDALVLIDGRYVLERTATITDSIVIEGSQVGIVSVSDCLYDEPSGITTVTTLEPHNFNVGDEVTMSGLKFTCPNSTGITTDIFPSPQQSFTVVSIEGSVGTSLTFTTNSGTAAGIAHTYVSGGLVGPLNLEFTCSILENSNV